MGDQGRGIAEVVPSLMRSAGIEVRRRLRFRATTGGRHRFPVAGNLLERQFEVAVPKPDVGGDLTALWTNEGRPDLAVIFDLYSRRVVSWA